MPSIDSRDCLVQSGSPHCGDGPEHLNEEAEPGKEPGERRDEPPQANDTAPDQALENEDLRRRIKELEDELERSESKVRELAGKNKKLEMDSVDLEETLLHLRRESESKTRIDARDIVGPFLEFSAGVYNAVLDNDDIGTVRDLVCFRLDQLSGSFSGLGMELRFHRRGEPLTDGRVDATLVTTDDSNLNMVVKRSNKFGFSFGSDTVPDIVEEVSVYECVDDASAGGEHSLEDARAASTFGIEVQHYDGRSCLFNMIYKGTPFGDWKEIVRRSERPFIPTSNKVPAVVFRIFETDVSEGEGFDGNYFDMDRGKAVYSFGMQVRIPPEYAGKAREYRIWPTMRLDRNGVLEFMLTDKDGKKIISIHRSTTGRLPCPKISNSR